MLKLNKSTKLALYAMLELARAGDTPTPAATLAERFGITPHHLAKVLQQLVRAGLVRSIRGAAGGHVLARDPRDVTLYDIVAVFEGPPRRREDCLLLEEEEICPRPSACALRRVFDEIDAQARVTLQSISLRTVLRDEETSLPR